MGITYEQHTACMKWANALSSGAYTQGYGRLLNAEGFQGGPRYCCLGVACQLTWPELFAANLREHLVTVLGSKGDHEADSSDPHAILSTDDWPDEAGEKYGMPKTVRRILSSANDNGVDFYTISRMIRAWADAALEKSE